MSEPCEGCLRRGFLVSRLSPRVAGLLDPGRRPVPRLLALSDEELLRVLDVDALALLSGEADALPQVPVLVALAAEAHERAGGAVLRRWVRASGPAGRPLDLLLARDFAGFEDALGVLDQRGLVLRSDG